jgi:hypothetical protein
MKTTKDNCFIREGFSKSNVPWAINIKRQGIAKFSVPRLFHWYNATFEHTPKHIQALSHFCNNLKNSLPAYSYLAFATLQEQPLNFLYCGIGFSNPNTSLTGHGHDRYMVQKFPVTRLKNSCVRRAPCGVVSPSCRIKPHERCSSLFLLTASRSRSSVSQVAFTLPDLQGGMYST